MYHSKALITSLVSLQKDIVSLWIKENHIAGAARPGQFVSLYSADKSRLLPRPVSICQTEPDEGLIRLVFRIAGSGTLEFSKLHPGDEIDITGPLGNGYDMSYGETKDSIITGGGIGIPPMLFLAEELKKRKDKFPDLKTEIVLGYRTGDVFLLKDFEGLGTIHIATEDGSLGTKGNVLDAIKEEGIQGKIIYACGPNPMLKGISAYAKEKGIKTFISLEERMACGIGACLACVCNTKNPDEHSNVNNKRICKDGPVFDAEDIKWE